MYPTKSKMDYMNETYRLFPRNSADDLFSSPLSPISSQSIPRSSSSTDTSPEAFPDITGRYVPNRLFDQNDQPIYPNLSLFSQNEHYETLFDSQRAQGPLEFQGTPYTARRPITGRKLTTEYLTQRNNDNLTYELFPARPFELTPHQNTTSEVMNMGPMMTELSPRMADLSPRMTDLSPRQNVSPKMTDFWPTKTVSPNLLDLSPRQNSTPTNVSPRRPEMSNLNLPRDVQMSQMPYTASKVPEMSKIYPPFKEPIAIGFRPNVPNKMCTFCRKNGETPLVYMTHAVKEKIGNRNVVTCPILRSHVCSACGASGDKAHTISYCPLLLSGNNGHPLPSTTITLKNTRVKSNGRRRY